MKASCHPAAPARPSPAVLAALREFRSSRRSLDATRTSHGVTLALLKTLARMLEASIDRARDADEAAARALMASGPVVDGAWRYEGACVQGLWTVVRTAVEGPGGRPVVAEAVTGIDDETA